MEHGDKLVQLAISHLGHDQIGSQGRKDYSVLDITLVIGLRPELYQLAKEANPNAK